MNVVFCYRRGLPESFSREVYRHTLRNAISLLTVVGVPFAVCITKRRLMKRQIDKLQSRRDV
jgi:hypothetical protein